MIQVHDLCALKYDADGIMFKLEWTDEWRPLPQRQHRNSKEVGKLHEAAPKITAKKYKHLQELKAMIPQRYQTYYDDLPH